MSPTTPPALSPLLDLGGRVALVTGASRGIGAATARLLGRCNARVAIHFGRSRAEAEAVAAEIALSGGPPAALFQAELASDDERRRLHREVASTLGDPLLLVHNAGIYVRNPFEETDDAAFLSRWRTTQAVNLEAAAHLTLLSLPAMRAARFGRVVMVASRAAFRAETDAASYAVSKAGMVSLARCLARNEGKHGITANAICPGWVDTAMARPDVAARRAEIEGEVPLGRIATPEDCARAILFYLSPLASYANGTALGLNGGSFLH
ncbi:MAG: SDR family oxidoreductase [Thermoanaerobaculia bacterium]|jgi:3-oxoacyl-[acyl-carrier protein] reductase|nr:SDR family oxidoreductase [Thermoanaerobaculia bacterium]